MTGVQTCALPILAQRIADAAAESFQQLNAQSAQQASRRRSLFIEEQLRSTDSLLLNAQAQLSNFRKNVNAFSPRDKFKATEDALGQMRLRREELAQEKRIYDQMYGALASGGERAAGEQVAALAASAAICSPPSRAVPLASAAYIWS